MDNFQTRLKKAIEIKGITQSELAEKLNISKGAITHYLNGDIRPKFENLNKLAKILSVNIDWLLGQSEEMELTHKPVKFVKKEYIFTDKQRKALRTRLLDTMIKKGFIQETLSENTDIPLEVINGYIIGTLEPKMEYLDKLAESLDVLPDFLIGEDRTADMQLLARKMNKLDDEKFKRAMELVDSIIESLEGANGLGK